MIYAEKFSQYRLQYILQGIDGSAHKPTHIPDTDYNNLRNLQIQNYGNLLIPLLRIGKNVKGYFYGTRIAGHGV